ncbi:MAG: response regulator, partial [Ferruginibacter sp.]
AEIIELSNYEVITAENGKLGVALALKERPDLIISDIMMPVLDGYGVYHLLSRHAETASIPFIFLTAKSERNDFRKGMEMGADDYISKPFTDIELLNAIDSRLKKASLLKKDYAKDPGGIQEMLSDFGEKFAIENIVHHGEENYYKKKHSIYLEGNHPYKLFFVKTGKVKTYITNDDGKSLTTGLFAGGDFFGYTAILEANVYKDTAETIDDSIIVDIPANEFTKLLYNDVGATKKIIQILSKNISEKEDQLLSIAYNSLRKRVATALLTLHKKFAGTGDENFVLNFSREDLANIAGTATESLIRTLSDFKNEKLIGTAGSKITILDEKKLSNMIN